MPSPPRSPLFPYTTLFRSGRVSRHGKEEVRPMELFQHFFTSSTSVEFTALLATLVLCSLIGLERQVRQKAAGLRTNVLVGMGSCTFTLVSGRSEGRRVGTEG